MQMSVKSFNQLTTTELYEILKSRAAVFVVEQKCVYQDLDDLDYKSLHIFYQEGKPSKPTCGHSTKTGIPCRWAVC